MANICRPFEEDKHKVGKFIRFKACGVPLFSAVTVYILTDIYFDINAKYMAKTPEKV